MKCFSKRALVGLVPAFLAALVLGVPTAAPDVSLQPVTIACSVDSPFTLSADPATLTELTLALAAMTDPTCAISQTDPTAVPDPTYAVGGGLDIVGEHFSFSAHQNTPNPPSGYAHVTGLGFDVQGHVTCLTFDVNPTTATIAFKIEKGTGQGSNLGAEFTVGDNGPPGSVPPDFFAGVEFTSSVPTTCPAHTRSGNSVVQGNIVVK